MLTGGLVFLLRRVITGDRETSIVPRTGFLLGGFVFVLLFMQGGLVRSDSGHITLAIFPMVFFAGTVLFSFPSRVASAIAALVAVVASLLFAGQPFPPPLLAQLLRPTTRLRHRMSDWVPTIRRGLPGGRICTDLEIIARHVQRVSGSQDSLVIFPYETIFGIASRRNVAGGVMQSYLVSGQYLSQLEISGLERASAPVGLYLPDADPNLGTDRDASFAIDGVSNFTRSPEVWFWILRHYRSEQQTLPGIFQLRRDDSRASQIAMQAQSLNIAARSFPIGTRSSVLDLGDPGWSGADGDFLRLRLTVRYNFWWKLRKPERLQLEITRADGTQRFEVVYRGTERSIGDLVFPWSEGDLASYFDADETHWRSNPRPTITRLRLSVTPFDWVSQQPYSIVVDSIDVVRLTMRH